MNTIFKKKFLSSISDENYIMATLEVDKIDWDTEENTPEFSKNEEYGSKRRNVKCVSAKNCDKFVPILSEHNNLVVGISNTTVIKKVASQENEFGTDNCFSFLADEIILNIFSYLPHSSLGKCAIVCKRWKKLRYDKTLWRQVNLHGKHIKHPYLSQILHRGVNILRLSQAEIFSTNNIDNCCLSDEEGCEGFPVSHLDATNAKFGSDVLASVLGKCQLLQNLSVEGCKIGLAECIAISFNENIEILNLSMVSGLSLLGIDTITKRCKMIKSLNLAWTNQTKDCLKFICRCKKLQELNLSGLKGGITIKVMEKLLTSCTQLMAIDLSDVKLQIGMLRLLSHLCRDIQKLSISRCSEVMPDGLLELNKLPRLSHLNLFGFVNTDTLDMFSKVRPDISLNKETFSPIARPITTLSYEGKIWEQYVGFIM